MRHGIFAMLMGLLLAGCLEKVDPISNIENYSPAAFGSGSVTLTWQPPTQNADGSPLTNLAGYKIYVGTDAGIYNHREIMLDNPGLTAYVIENLGHGTYYFVATAVNSAGIESFFSDELAIAVNP
jgi:hypothetical protein